MMTVVPARHDSGSWTDNDSPSRHQTNPNYLTVHSCKLLLVKQKHIFLKNDK